MAFTRRGVIGSGAAVATALALRSGANAEAPRLARVILDNDFAGDPDGLFQLAHHLLCKSLRISLIVGSHLPNMPFAGPDAPIPTGKAAAAKAQQLVDLMRLPAPPIVAGADAPILDRKAWRPAPSTAAIVREAMREDTAEPLIYCVGAGLTDLALAWLAEPRIGKRLKLVWIGGSEHAGLANAPPGAVEPEFNFSIDPLAAQVIFNDSDIEIWQVPRDAYRQMLFPNAEIEELATLGPLGAYLKAQVDKVSAVMASIPGIPPIPPTETYVLGDSPLVTLTALVTQFQPDPASSTYVRMPTPRIEPDGQYVDNPAARPMRVYTHVDAELTFRDMLAKFRAHMHAG
ncbi:nucleoside hydrolase [Novosphingobium olei]|uniref:Nucleoside hydrolase n=1 Tax=Novosphingobium olei TaxID=2728851 RepID=A0A7Y0GA66_9SPHN|nr:nucleoside hydrolase [Novosphingobium olei]NML93579.1 nucleoside hydrolase [Novosphingobium olei]